MPDTSPVLPGWYPDKPRRECDRTELEFAYPFLHPVHRFLMSPSAAALHEALWCFRTAEDDDVRRSLASATTLAVLLATARGHPQSAEFAAEALKFLA
jgi:hypothetical protein